MSPEAFHAAALALPGATYDVKWGADAVFSLGGRMFAAYGPIGSPTPAYSFKASDIAFEMWVEQGLARPAPYAARQKWLQLLSPDGLPDAEIAALLVQAHALIAMKLSGKRRRELGIVG